MEDTSAVESLLIKCNLENYIGIFKENSIDNEALHLLDDDALKDLISSVGHRVKFKNALNLWKAEQECMINSYFNTERTTEINDKNQNTLIENEQETQKATTTQPRENVTESHNRMINSNTERTTEINNKNQNTLIENEQETQKATTTQPRENVTESHNRETLDGRALLKEGEKNGGLLKEASRRKLSQILIINSLEKDPMKQIKTDEFYKLAADISEIFNKESPLVYYSAYVSASCHQNKKNASGKLYETYITRRRKLRARGDLPPTNRTPSTQSTISSTLTASTSTSSASTCTLSPTRDSDNDDPIIQEKLSWLRNNVDPWTVVEEYWTDTAAVRLNPILKGQGDIQTYIKEFPSIKQPLGYTLLMNDFSFIYPEKENQLFNNIEEIKENIINLGKLKGKSTRDKYIKDTINDYLSHVDDNAPETKTNAALLLLPYIINLSPARKQRSWKPSRSEIRDGFITQAATTEEVGSILETRKIKFAKLGKTLQPLIIYVGRSLSEVECAYVVINDILYHFKKLITAVDVAFKVFQATGACYPEEASDIWLVIQIGFYNIRTQFDRTTQAANVLLCDLGLVVN